MGSELVDSAPPPSISYTEQFYEQFPFYLSIGMTYDQYWNDDCCLVKYYRQAYKIGRDRKNQELWLQGMYIYEALCNVSPVLHAFAKPGTKPLPYSDKPYPISKEEVEMVKKMREKENRLRAKMSFMNWVSQLKLPSAKEDVKKNGTNN